MKNDLALLRLLFFSLLSLIGLVCEIYFIKQAIYPLHLRYYYMALMAKVNLSRNIWPPLKESFNRMKLQRE